MHDQHGIRRYREADIGSMGKEKMIALLYEKMIGCYRQAERAIAAGDRVLMADRIGHIQRIITELNGALDDAVGGDIARNLAALYDYIFLENLQVLTDSDPGHLQNCQRVLCPLLEAWRQIPPGTGTRAAREHAANAPGPNPANSDPDRPNDRDAPTEAGEPAGEESPLLRTVHD